MSSPITRPLSHLRTLTASFDHVLVDQWGVLHEGSAVFPEARAALEGLRDAGKPVLVLSNSGKRAADNARRLVALGLPEESYAGIVTSGEATWLALAERDRAPFDALGRRCWLISRGGDRSVVEGVGLELVSGPEDADFLLLSGLDDAVAELEAWREPLAAAVAAGLPLLCANPDVTMIGAAGLLPGPGRLALFYESLGGRLTFVGKPHRPIYETCLRLLGNPDPARVLAIGDSLDHDILGGKAMGMQTLLIADGIHGPALKAAGSPAELAALAGELAAPDRRPDWVMPRLLW